MLIAEYEKYKLLVTEKLLHIKKLDLLISDRKKERNNLDKCLSNISKQIEKKKKIISIFPNFIASMSDDTEFISIPRHELCWLNKLKENLENQS